MPLPGLPLALQVVARALPLTYAVEALEQWLHNPHLGLVVLDWVTLAAFSVALFWAATGILERRLA